MKIEVTYEIVEVTRYRISRSFKTAGGGMFAMGVDSDTLFGEFERKEDAEKVAKALEAVAAQEARRGV